MLLRLTSNCVCLLALMLTIPIGMNAAFIGSYDPNNWTLTNNEADGLATLQNDGSLVIIGGNNGSGNSGYTDFLIAAVETGIVSFHFFYTSQDAPGGDSAGYILNNVYTELANSVASPPGDILFNVIAGQTFGFRILTVDNTGEPGILTISNFSAPSGLSGVPEPSTWFTTLSSLAVFGAYWRRKSAN